MGFLYTSLDEIKAVLGIDPVNTQYDLQLGIYNKQAASIFDEFLDRPVSYETRTVIYPGTGNQKLLLKHRPVYPTAAPPKAANLPFTAISVTIDDSSGWGFASGAFQQSNGAQPLVLGTDYGIRVDQDDGGSREAILYNINGPWPKPIYRMNGELSPFVGPDMGSVQVTTTAGWTVDTMPATLRMAADMLIARLRVIFPLAMQVTSESYIERSVGLSENQRRFLLGLLRPYLIFFRNWKF